MLDINICIFGNIMGTSLTFQQTLLIERHKLDRLRQAVAKGAVQAERKELSVHTVESLLEELNRQEPTELNHEGDTNHI